MCVVSGKPRRPGVIQAWGIPTPGQFDLVNDPAGADELGTTLAATFSAATLDSRAAPDIQRWKRGKLLTNLSNAVDALCGPPG
ncbi:MAG: hypothetical protein M3680_35645, partial [Myxococcota bacterium]|nr:hypothetical protein [Myxococcota bacterium]